MLSRSLQLLSVFLSIASVATAEKTTCCPTPAKPAEQDSRVVFFFGPGLTGLKDDFVDFKEVREGDEHIFIDNDSRLRPEVMTGTLIKLYKRFDAVVGLEFAKGGQGALDGIFFGAGVKLNEHVEFVAGYSRGLGKELSHGFQQAMGQFIQNNGKNSEKYPKLNDIDLVDGVIADIRDYDGLPLYIDKTTNNRIFPGDPITNSFNSRFSVGILFRFDIWEKIKGELKSTGEQKKE